MDIYICAVVCAHASDFFNSFECKNEGGGKHPVDVLVFASFDVEVGVLHDRSIRLAQVVYQKILPCQKIIFVLFTRGCPHPPSDILLDPY